LNAVRNTRGGIRAAALATVLCIGQSAYAADLEAGKRKAETCVACHGTNGNATLPNMPSLAAQPAFYLLAQLVQFKTGQRNDPQMTPFAESLADADIENIAAYYAAQPLAPASGKPDPMRAAAGKKIADANQCGSCHLPDYSGREQIGRLAGQREDYLFKAMQDYRDARRSGFDGQMTGILRGFSDQDLADLAHYFAHLR
jgi:cytochrome c553